MSNIVKNQNKKAFQYYLQNISLMCNFAKPLKDYLGIECFGYLKVYNDGSYLSLINGFEEYHKKYYDTVKVPDKHFLKMYHMVPHLETRLLNWEFNPRVNGTISSLHKEFKIGNGCSIARRSDSYVEFFCFSLRQNHKDNSKYYIKNYEELRSFASLFKLKFKDIIDCNDKSKLARYSKPIDLYPQNEMSKFREFIENEYQKSLFNEKLTKREYQSYKLLVTGITTKQIASQLNISHRTIEHYIKNIKKKSGFNFKSEIINDFNNNSI